MLGVFLGEDSEEQQKELPPPTSSTHSPTSSTFSPTSPAYSPMVVTQTASGPMIVVGNNEGEYVLCSLPPPFVSKKSLPIEMWRETRQQDARTSNVHFPFSENSLPLTLQRTKQQDQPNHLLCNGREYSEIRTKPCCTGLSFVSISCDSGEQVDGWKRLEGWNDLTSEITFAAVPLSTPFSPSASGPVLVRGPRPFLSDPRPPPQRQPSASAATQGGQDGKEEGAVQLKQLMLVRMHPELKERLSSPHARVRMNDANGTYELMLPGPAGTRESVQTYSMERTASPPATNVTSVDTGEKSPYQIVGCGTRMFTLKKTETPSRERLTEKIKEWQPPPKPVIQACTRKHLFVPLKTASDKKREREETQRKALEKDAKVAKSAPDDPEAVKRVALEMFHTSPYLSKAVLQQKTGARMSSVVAVLNDLCNHVSGGARRGFYTLKPEFGGTVDARTGQGR
mmetsp:Transcript_9576/g.16381  ORF Transcript_9576/g.16381 Transcript_9576/m.16381 type:complete len:454 (+) Transcript_9576:338-1699(+)